MTDGEDPRPYRPCVGIMLFNAAGHVFVGKRVDVDGDHWQMPQGGIDPGETPRQAALRELEEETGTDKAKILAESAAWHRYDLPPDLSRKAWKGRFRGQEQRWFAMRFTGRDSDIDLDAHVTEFSAWQWVPVDRLSDLIIPFKRDVYRDLVAEFARFAAVSDRKSG